MANSQVKENMVQNRPNNTDTAAPPRPAVIYPLCTLEMLTGHFLPLQSPSTRRKEQSVSAAVCPLLLLLWLSCRKERLNYLLGSPLLFERSTTQFLNNTDGGVSSRAPDGSTTRFAGAFTLAATGVPGM